MRIAAHSILALTLLAACGGEPTAGTASSSAAPATSRASAPATTAAPAAAAAPSKPALESLVVKPTGKKSSDGHAMFDVTNTNSVDVKVVFFQFYAYDADGKQIGSTDLSWNSPIPAGKTESIYLVTPWEPGKTAATVELTYHGVKLAGADQVVTDDKRSPSKKAKGEFPGTAPGATTPAAAEAPAGSASAAPGAASGLDAYTGSYTTEWGTCDLRVDGEKVKGLCKGRGTTIDCTPGSDGWLSCSWAESSGSGRARLKRDDATGRINGTYGNGGSSAGGGAWIFVPKK
jgi:uncharacterized protein YcfL